MKGSNHVIANVATVGICCVAIKAASTAVGPEVLAPVTDYLTHDWVSDLGAPSVPLLVFALDVIAFLIASILPDIDSPTSTLGRHIPFPGPHRGIAHSIWPCLIFLVAGTACGLFTWVAIGYFLHLFWDSFSAAGICWFYPISNYRRYGSGAFVKKGWHLTLYRSNDASESIVVGILVGVLVLLVFLGAIGTLPLTWQFSWDGLRGLVTGS